MTWLQAVEDARELAEGAPKSDRPEHHVQALAKSVMQLCDVIEEMGRHVGLPQVDQRPLTAQEEEATYDHEATLERVKEAARKKVDGGE